MLIQAFILLSAQTPTGVCPCSLRFWRGVSEEIGTVPLVLWEIRRFGDVCGVIGSRYVHKWVAESLRAGTWSKIFALSGCALTVVASRRAQSVAGGTGHGYAQEEWTIETTALICLLCFWMNSGNTIAGLLLHTLFRNTIPLDGIDTVLTALQESSAWSLCKLEPQDSVCEHMRPALAKAKSQHLSNEEKYATVVSMCGALVFYLATCVSAQQVWPSVLRLIGRLCVQGLSHVSHSDPLRDASHDPFCFQEEPRSSWSA